MALAAARAAAVDGDDGSPRDVRGAVHCLHREIARRAWPAWTPGAATAAAAGPTVSAWLTERAGPEVAPGVGPSGGGSDPLAGLLATLRALTTRFACRLRADGARPEQMLVRVKACVRDAMVAEGWQDPEAVRALTAAVVGWSIAAYYDR